MYNLFDLRNNNCLLPVHFSLCLTLTYLMQTFEYTGSKFEGNPQIMVWSRVTKNVPWFKIAPSLIWPIGDIKENYLEESQKHMENGGSTVVPGQFCDLPKTTHREMTWRKHPDLRSPAFPKPGWDDRAQIPVKNFLQWGQGISPI